MRTHKFSLRYLHRFISSVMIFPILLTLITGTLYQFVDLQGNGDQFQWLLEAHKGHIGSLNLERVYPFLNALGLLALTITGIFLWLRTRRNARRKSEQI
jgi:uncharacterized iron-regulated membrane protein